MTPEFSRTVRIDILGERPRALEIEADEAERRALAARFGLAAIEALAAEASLTRGGEEVRARGRVRARVVQSCVATGAPLPAEIDAPLDLVFRPQLDAADEEVELGAEELDVVFYDGAAVDLGEAAAETMALALDPFPRAPDAAEALRTAGVKSEEEAGPFGALAALRDPKKQR